MESAVPVVTEGVVFTGRSAKNSVETSGTFTVKTTVQPCSQAVRGWSSKTDQLRVVLNGAALCCLTLSGSF
ncbi:MAG: hypothetical protein DBY25_03215 [Clostridiales bacterium]|nr:MAG: hypothetical protein DBY25_03215 [Clostridiales bacterium]